MLVFNFCTVNAIVVMVIVEITESVNEGTPTEGSVHNENANRIFMYTLTQMSTAYFLICFYLYNNCPEI